MQLAISSSPTLLTPLNVSLKLGTISLLNAWLLYFSFDCIPCARPRVQDLFGGGRKQRHRVSTYANLLNIKKIDFKKINGYLEKRVNIIRVRSLGLFWRNVDTSEKRLLCCPIWKNIYSMLEDDLECFRTENISAAFARIREEHGVVVHSTEVH